MLWQGKSSRSHTGKLLRSARRKRKFEMGGKQVETLIGDRKVKKRRTKGGDDKLKLFRESHANVFIPSEKKMVKSEIKNVVENPAHVHYSRRNVVTRGAIIETEAGKARVTSRPSQDGVVNAVLEQ
ncbi:MAG: 30S ribosomal protein S8e [Archaeoglobaceae archaeon]